VAAVLSFSDSCDEEENENKENKMGHLHHLNSTPLRPSSALMDENSPMISPEVQPRNVHFLMSSPMELDQLDVEEKNSSLASMVTAKLGSPLGWRAISSPASLSPETPPKRTSVGLCYEAQNATKTPSSLKKKVKKRDFLKKKVKLFVIYQLIFLLNDL